MVTIKEVAEKAGVSIATVSRVVHNRGKVGDERRKYVQSIIDELGYRPNSHAQALVKQKATQIGVVTPKLSMAFFGCLAAGVEDAARENQYQLLMCNSLYETQTEIGAIQSLHHHNCRAIILHSEYSDPKTLRKIAKEVPGLVLINRYIPSLKSRCIWLDNVAGGHDITKHLIENGHTQIAAVTSIYKNNDPEQRLEGMRQAMSDAGLEFNENLVELSTANIRGGAEAIKALLKKKDKFTAVFAYNDLMAIGVINELRNCGLRVPEDVSVVGFDQSPISEACRPALTTMHYPIEKMAYYATELAIKLSDGEPNPNPENNQFSANLVLGKSVMDIR